MITSISHRLKVEGGYVKDREVVRWLGFSTSGGGELSERVLEERRWCLDRDPTRRPPRVRPLPRVDSLSPSSSSREGEELRRSLLDHLGGEGGVLLRRPLFKETPAAFVNVTKGQS
uniref:Uncharacterized protein n=1 Tax=Timema bartmani TaxID=61472 RepID=A0A7R9F0Z0_9NEOP|nr:unnamed protein product [Timema bartmani]